MALEVQLDLPPALLFIRHLSIVIFLLLLSTNTFSDEFIVSSFEQIDNKIHTTNQKVYDDNDELCAIVMNTGIKKKLCSYDWEVIVQK